MASSGPDLLLPPLALPEELVRNLVGQNPWWSGGALPHLPAYRRWPFGKLIARLDQPVAPINVVRGPRQIGKTTLQLQIIDALLKRGVTPTRIFRVQFDDLPTLKDRRLQEPILRLVEWFENSVLKSTDRNPHLMDLAGRVAESTAGYYLSSITGLAVSHLPERGGDPGVDYVLTIGERRIPVEIKYRRQIDSMRDTLGLRAFIEKAANNAPFGLLITREDAQAPADPRIITVPLRALLIVR